MTAMVVNDVLYIIIKDSLQNPIDGRVQFHFLRLTEVESPEAKSQAISVSHQPCERGPFENAGFRPLPSRIEGITCKPGEPEDSQPFSLEAQSAFRGFCHSLR